MPNKTINDLTLRSSGVEDDVNFPVQDGVQSWRVTGAQIYAFIKRIVGAKSADYTVTDTDKYFLVNVTTANTARTVTLPTAADNTDRMVTIKKVDSGTGTVTIEGEGAELVEGAANLVLTSQYDSATLICDGSAWHVVTTNLAATTSAKGVVTTGTQSIAGTKTFENAATTVGVKSTTNNSLCEMKMEAVYGGSTAQSWTVGLNKIANTGALEFYSNTQSKAGLSISKDGIMTAGPVGTSSVHNFYGCGSFNAPSGFSGNHFTLSQDGTGTSQNYFVAINGSETKAIITGTGAFQSRPNSYGGISDRRLKENISNADSMIERLKKIKVRKFSFKSDKKSKADDIGVIAQELSSVFPEFVQEVKMNGKETLSVAYSKFVPVLLKAVQEQQAMIEELQKKIG